MEGPELVNKAAKEIRHWLIAFTISLFLISFFITIDTLFPLNIQSTNTNDWIFYCVAEFIFIVSCINILPVIKARIKLAKIKNDAIGDLIKAVRLRK